MDYIEKHANNMDNDATIISIVGEAIRQSSTLKEPEHAKVRDKCWFNLLFGIIFKVLDPTTKNIRARGCPSAAPAAAAAAE